MEGFCVREAGATARVPGRDSTSYSWWRHALAWALCLLAILIPGAASATSYVYDANGRLIAVTNDAGESARYVYDVMGNTVQVDRIGVDELALFSFTPARGVSGTQVRLQGHAFSAEASSNLVRFGAVAATVSRASRDELLVTVPAGAVTGPVSVAVGNQFASSITDFIVDQSPLAPRIDSIAPTLVNEGANIEVSGTQLSPVAGQSTVRVSNMAAIASATSNTELSFSVPAGAHSGKVSVATAYGMAVSTQDLVVLPRGLAASSFSGSTRLLPDAPASTFSISAAGQQVAILYDAVEGEYLDAQFFGISVPSIAYTLYDPTNSAVVTGNVSAAVPTILLPKATRGGTYLLVLRPSQGPASWSLSIERSKPIGVDGEVLHVSTSVPGQKKRYIFGAEQLDRLGVGATDLVISSGTYVNLSAYGATGNAITSAAYYKSNGGEQMNLAIVASGINTLVISPQSGAQSMSLALALSRDLVIALPREPVVDLQTSRRGENVHFVFHADAGETLALQAYGIASEPTGKSIYFNIYRPDGTLLTSKPFPAFGTILLAGLPLTGDYTVMADGQYGATASGKLRLTAGGDSGMALNGPQTAISTSAPGQPIFITFFGTAGQTMGLGLGDLVTAGNANVGVSVFGPTGTQLASTVYDTTRDGAQLNLTIATTGVHGIVVAPPAGAQPMQLNATLSEDLRIDLVRETVRNLALPRRGQNARLFFQVEEGETLGLQVAGQVPAVLSKWTYYRIIRPDGTQIASANVQENETFNLPQLTIPGTYQLFVDPAHGQTIEANVVLTSGRTSGVTVNGPPGDVSASVGGQSIYVAFDAVAGQSLGVGVSDLAVPNYYVNADMYDPSGARVGHKSFYTNEGGGEFNLTAAMSGTYVLLIPAFHGETMSLKVTVSEDLELPLQRNLPTTLALTHRGQNGRMAFTASAGDALALQISGLKVNPSGNPVSFSVRNPAGTVLQSWAVTSPGRTVNLGSLTADGEYLLFVDPECGATLEAGINLSAGSVAD